MTPTHRPPAAGSWLLAALVAVFAVLAVFAVAIVLRSLAGWDVEDAAWRMLLLLVSVVAWCWARARWPGKR